jgi:hypothetical protein
MSTREKVYAACRPHGSRADSLQFEGDALGKMTDADLTAIIRHGGPALNKSALMPPAAIHSASRRLRR